MIYLDNAATSWPKPEGVAMAVYDCILNKGANPGRSGHKMALEAGRIVLECRETLAEFFGIDDPMRIIFALNTTDALNMAIKGLLRPGQHAVTSSMEHNSVARPLKKLESIGVETTYVSADGIGLILPDDIEKAIKPNTAVIILTLASNVTGTIEPYREIGRIARRHGIPFLLDAAQGAGHIPINVNEDDIDIMAFPGHKGLLGPQGTGGLYIREGIDLDTIKEGGTGSHSDLVTQPDIMPDRYESGTLNTPGIAGLKAGIDYINSIGIEAIRKHEIEICGRIIDGLKEIDGVKVYGPQNAEMHAGVVAFNVGNMDSTEVSYILDSEFEIEVRAGLHCSGLAHMTIGTFGQGVVRVSPGPFTTEQEIGKFLEAVRQIARL
ncbi:MAG: aminotransferase class V-fold PLP-dependent enzyme [Thermoanaerobacteraceae bacterium]|nr:aminotransferase class V-fold PLP-dependent enzyme [Thermoanaerobacteraceae bacterium]